MTFINESKRHVRRTIAQALVHPKTGRPRPMPEKFSAETLDAIGKLERHGALHRRHGGYWTYAGCPDITKSRGIATFSVPEWYALTTTIRDIVDRGRAKWTPTGESIEYVPRGEADVTESA